MKCKIGLKLFSNNIDSIKIAEKCYAERLFDYLELMALPETCDKSIKCWEKLKVPYIIHAPHGKHGFNLSDPELRKHNKRIFDETRKYADSLNSEFIIVHPGLTGQVSETIRQIKGFKEERLIIENTPFISLLQTRCVGSSPDEIRIIIKQAGIGFCLDIVHAAKAAFANGKDYIDYVKRFLFLKPQIIHLCDCKINGCFDEHLNLGAGKLDLRIIIDISLKSVSHANFTLEIPERSYQKLTSFKKARLLLNKYLKD